MSTDEPFRTDYELLKGVDLIFVSLDRNLSGEECHELAQKYFETHKQMTLPGRSRATRETVSRVLPVNLEASEMVMPSAHL